MSDSKADLNTSSTGAIKLNNPFMQSWLVPALVSLAIAGRLLLSVYSTWRHAQKSHRLGCGEVPLYSSQDPFGLSTLFETLEAAREKLLPHLAERRMALLSLQHDRYVSTFRLCQAGRENLFTADPKNIQAMLATQFNDFSLGDMRRNVAEPVVGHGIFTTDGESWSRSRSLLRPQFTRDQMSNLDKEEHHVHNALRAIPMLPDGWSSVVDIQAIFFRLTLDSATEFLFGKSCGSQIAAMQNETGQASDDTFLYAFDRCMWYLAKRLRFERLYWVIYNQEFRKCINIVHAFVDQYVHSALKQAQQQEEKAQSIEKIPSQYVFLKALTNTTKDPVRLRDECLNVLLAGRDTTASLLSWTILLLSRHPHIFARLRSDILEQFGTHDQPRNMNFATLKSCQYLQYFLKETLRLYPVVPFNRRCATRDTTLPRGGGEDGTSPIYIRKGRTVMYGTYVLHRRKDIWGQDAEIFNPDRWADRKVTWEYIPFNGGPRTCIGQQFALMRSSYVLVRLLQKFDRIEEVHSERQIRYGVSLTSCPADPVTVRLHQAKIEV
ncbi:Cytochrome P450 E-class CYP52 [Penicillium atrosanguineum]|uniref:Cytochrome P450 E-class CYP52 n=1 Tax=Penicillium atrosanguineum TaxID=1132637 RepID=A0A9W9L714_9EURO|nr:Cytochrome P450 E-class CYP52 [Penicillium atrosanguineum]KAJ5139437.1 Cytochrome P450 E-class CYP52 [Penicillium atrosanguineum]KAJ5314870.1 Cytochrome P450 E-class CYP52 [Penicillium atrosanguineum]